MTMIQRLAFAMLATATIPHILGTPAYGAEIAVSGAISEQHDRFTVERIGDSGPDVILIPGLATPREVYAGLADALRGTARLHLVQLRGFAAGDPGPNAQGGAIAGLTNGLADYIASHKLSHVRLVGHSLGGLAALRLARLHPANIDGVMIVDAMPFIGTLFMGPAATVEAAAPQAAMMRDRMLAMAAAGGKLPPATDLAASQDGKAKITQWTAAADLRTVAMATYEDLTTDERSGLATISAPLTIVFPWSGATDAPTRAAYEAAYKAVPKIRFVPVAQSGHFVMLDQPAAFAAAVRDFIAAH
ncbi:alpha/beta fold hydrolase [Sphingobium nicotianae]|uniref:Alpha/beta hydrolase n=1 Tax=Sphingobium nicotianae TaxID=2782607 RepID=A0A9X1DAV3_9SPHN|nr:alpha/beta hydrolase [Sphingobium nicotianae]MBT2186363.1 alpha/beta hydrolase [Sphingobium nicotianae]